MAVDTSKYKETKVCQCICCGKDVTVTKFASAAKVVCDECKASGAQPDTTILGDVVAKNKKEPRAKHEGGTKICQCINCGVDVEVTKFASAAKVLCADCRDDGSPSYEGSVNRNVRIDMGKLDRSVIPPLEEYIAQPLMTNKALRDVECMSCGHKPMRILKVLDWSIFGLIVHYQCPECGLLVSVSEQTKHQIKVYEPGALYDYSGLAIENTLSGVESSRITNIARTLYEKVKEHNIEITGIELPPYLWENKRPVPIGFTIPRGDKDIKAIDDTIGLLNRLHAAGDEQEFKSIQADTKTIIDGLKKLFTTEGNGDE